MSEESIQNDTTYYLLSPHSLVPVYISERILMLEVSFQKLDKCKCICVLHG